MKPRTKMAGRAFALLAGALAITAPGCFALSDGLDPPKDQFYYPTSIVMSPGRHTLYVVNSDFDIQYTGGTVQAVAIDDLRKCIRRLDENLADGQSAEDVCHDVGLPLNPDPVLYPGPCGAIDLSASPPIACVFHDNPPVPILGPFVKTSHVIGAFASSATLVLNPTANPADAEADARLFVAVRGDPSITYFNTTNDLATAADPFALDCLAEGNDALGEPCGPASRVGANPYESTRLLRLPVEPVGVAATDDGQAIVAVHQTGGAASLLFNAWDVKPALEFIASGLPDSPSDIAAIPTPGLIRALRSSGATVDYRPGFLVTLSGAREVDMLRFYDDSKGTSRHFLQRVASFSISTNSDGGDSRGIAIDDSERKACEAPCGDDTTCLKGCLDTPLRVFIANRTPSSLLLGKLETELIEDASSVTGVTESVNMNDMLPLTAGPSRVSVGRVLDKEGHLSPRVFVVSFDSRYLVIYNPLEHRIEATVRTGRGPHAMAFDVAEGTPAVGTTPADPGHALLYVAHFTDSYIGAIDLDARHPRTYGSMIATVGKPIPPKDSN